MLTYKFVKMAMAGVKVNIVSDTENYRSWSRVLTHVDQWISRTFPGLYSKCP